ncbi:receptor homology region, transmembrane domain- and RING domain-containing protein 2-like [Rutidosis leptorrhynchoides]|uniref:receptor homology region, transmembrane domain- and RING domain-containing protein 2-like n=1 Tax=Rutidosis leptorrhynchoides TaxID=125765 RepID=UPI003A9A08EF
MLLYHWVFYCFLSLMMMTHGAVANVVLMGNNITLSFDDIEANFAPPVKGSGECGTLFLAEPLDACAPLKNDTIKDSVNSPFVLILRGVCSFEDKVRRAQSAGYKAAIVYNNDDSDLVAMAGDSAGISIHAVFVSKSAGLKLSKYAGITTMETWLIQSYENSAWSIMAISFISLLAMSAVLATCFFVRRHRIRRDRPHTSRVREFHGMSSRLVKAMPSLVFTAVLEDNCTSATCAICLEDYNVGDKLRILPCRHKFHAICVDAWLTSWRTFCPVCKRDARTANGEPPASERTPLLSSNPGSMASSTMLSSVYSSSYASSRAIQINQTSRTNSNVHSVSSTPYNLHSSLQSHQSPYITPSQSALDIRNVASSSHRSRASYLISSNSLGYNPSLSPRNSRHLSSSYYYSPGNASSSYMWSSSQQQPHPLRHNDSAASFSPYTSAHSLPEC